jgi:hypothetical protein
MESNLTTNGASRSPNSVSSTGHDTAQPKHQGRSRNRLHRHQSGRHRSLSVDAGTRNQRNKDDVFSDNRRSGDTLENDNFTLDTQSLGMPIDLPISPTESYEVQLPNSEDQEETGVSSRSNLLMDGVHPIDTTKKVSPGGNSHPMYSQYWKHDGSPHRAHRRNVIAREFPNATPTALALKSPHYYHPDLSPEFENALLKEQQSHVNLFKKRTLQKSAHNGSLKITSLHEARVIYEQSRRRERMEPYKGYLESVMNFISIHTVIKFYFEFISSKYVKVILILSELLVDLCLLGLYLVEIAWMTPDLINQIPMQGMEPFWLWIPRPLLIWYTAVGMTLSDPLRNYL